LSIFPEIEIGAETFQSEMAGREYRLSVSAKSLPKNAKCMGKVRDMKKGGREKKREKNEE